MGTSLLRILQTQTIIDNEITRYCRDRSNRIIEAIQTNNEEIRAILRTTGVIHVDSNGENPVEGLSVLLGRSNQMTIRIEDRLLQLYQSIKSELNPNEELREHEGSVWILGNDYGICITVEFYNKNASEMGWSDGQTSYTQPLRRMSAYRALLELKKWDQDQEFIELVKAKLSQPAILARYMNPTDRMVHAIVETKREIARKEKDRVQSIIKE